MRIFRFIISVGSFVNFLVLVVPRDMGWTTLQSDGEDDASALMKFYFTLFLALIVERLANLGVGGCTSLIGSSSKKLKTEKREVRIQRRKFYLKANEASDVLKKLQMDHAEWDEMMTLECARSGEKANWEEDDDVSNCRQCNAKFTTLHRRHRTSRVQ